MNFLYAFKKKYLEIKHSVLDREIERYLFTRKDPQKYQDRKKPIQAFI